MPWRFALHSIPPPVRIDRIFGEIYDMVFEKRQHGRRKAKHRKAIDSLVSEETPCLNF
jgi:hypothetical protein